MITNPTIDDAGNKFWTNENGNLHRDEGDKPACEWNNGDKYWCKNGHYHRENGLPAIETRTGSKHWYDENTVCYRYDDWITWL